MRSKRRRRLVLVACVAAVAAGTLVASSISATAPRIPNGDWPSFGRTVDNNRFSPLTEITPANVDQLGRVYTVDFLRIDPDTRRGQQSYPLAIGGTLYVTTNDANVFAIEGATGKILWQRKPAQQRGLQELRNGGEPRARVLRRQAVHPPARHAPRRDAAERRTGRRRARDQPGRPERVGRTTATRETSAPICANGKLDLRRRGLRTREPRLRDGVHDGSQAGLADAVLDDPAGSPVLAESVADRRRWPGLDACHGRSGDEHRLLRHRLRDARLLPGPAPRHQPADGLADRRRSGDREAEVVAAADRAQPVGVRRRAAAARLQRAGRRSRSVASSPSRRRRASGTPSTPARGVRSTTGSRSSIASSIRRCSPGQPVTIFPGSIGGLNYSPAAYDPRTNYVFNAAAETAGVLIQHKLTPTQKKRKFLLGDIYLGLENGNFGAVPPELEGPRLDQRDQRLDRTPGLEVRHARARAWRGHRSPPAGSASQAAVTASCAPSTSGPARCCGPSRPVARSRRARRSSRREGSSTSRSRSAGRPRRRAAAWRRSCRCSRSAGTKAESPRPPGLAAAGPPVVRAAGRSQAAPHGRSRRPPRWPQEPGSRFAGGAITADPLEPEQLQPSQCHGASRRFGGRPVAGRGSSVDRYVLPAADGRRRNVRGCRRHDARATPSRRS